MISHPSSSPQGLAHPHSRAIVLQEYFLLQEQHEALQQHLEELRPLRLSMPTISSTTPSSPAASPPSAPFKPFTNDHTAPYHHGRRTSVPLGSRRRLSVTGMTHAECSLIALGLEAELDMSTATGLAAEEAKLFDVNEGIKRTLTELLNSEAVRSDRAFRAWVLRRLMDAEKELRSGRRRRGANRSREGSETSAQLSPLGRSPLALECPGAR